MLLLDILAIKGYKIVQVPVGTILRDALKLMVAQKVGAVIVINNGEPVGVFTERDAIKAGSDEKIDLSKTKVDEFMTRNIVCGLPGDKVENAMAVMTEQRVRHLPIVEGGKVQGVVSIGDVVKAMIQTYKAEVHYLKNYIQGY